MTTRNEPIAIVGMAGLFPKSPDLRSYWANVVAGADCITDVPADHSWSTADYLDPDPKAPDRTWCGRGGFLEPIPFDPVQHGIPPAQLDAIDTSQLLSLIVAREALRDAGFDPDADGWARDRVSCIIGVTGTQELAITLGARLQGPIWRRALLRHGVDPKLADAVVADIGKHFPEWQEQSFPGLLGNVVAGRITNRLGLGGTNCVVDAACASSLAAMQLAIADLAAGRSDLALTGGVDTLNDIFMYMCFSKTPALSKSGDARPFDADADGILISEGIGMVALERLSDAERLGHRVYAVVHAIGSGSDGRAKSIYAPNPRGQARTLKRAWEEAGFPLDTCDLIEAHGTGTKAGDAAELDGLTEVFGAVDHPIAVGSVKSQIGHTKSAAGIAGLMKAALALHQRVLPPTVKIRKAAAALTGPLRANTELRPWIRSAGHPRRAGVSAFGFGGSNYHAVLEEHVGGAEAGWALPPVEALFLIGAPDAATLGSRLDALLAAAGTCPNVHALSREALSVWAPASHVVSFTADSLDAARAHLTTAKGLLGGSAASTKSGVHYGVIGGPRPRVAFVFPGQGSQVVGMARDVVCRYPEARAVLDRAEATLTRAGSLAGHIWPVTAGDDAERKQQERALTATDWAQPALGAVEAAELAVLAAYGVRPDMVAGHSFGELVALHAAGALSERDLITLARARGEAMADRGVDRGTMAAVSAPLAEIEACIRELGLDVVLANRNHPKQGVLSGTKEAIARAIEALAERKIAAQPIPVAAAFHSPLVADAAAPLAAALASADVRAPTLPVYANVTAAPYPTDPNDARALLVAQITSPVDFVGVLQSMWADGARIFVEVGPKAVLHGLCRRTLPKAGATLLALDVDGPTVDGELQLLRVLAQLAALGVPVDARPMLSRPQPSEARPVGSKATVLLAGANYRKPETKAPPAPKSVPRPAAPPPVPAQERTMSQPTPPPVAARPEPRPAPAPLPAAAPAPAAAPVVDAAGLAAIRDGLLAFQRAQEQLASVHTEFLRAHAKANDSFAALFARQAALLGGGAVAAAPAASVTAPAPAPAPVVAPVAPATADVSRMPPAARALAESFLSPEPARRAPAMLSPGGKGIALQSISTTRPSIASDDDIPSMSSATGGPPAAAPKPPPSRPTAPATDPRQSLLAAIAEKTGYPVDMITDGMDLEADLGIDSIKRVEILAAVQERIPSMPEIAGDRLAALRTVAEVAAVVRENAGVPSPVAAPAAARPTVDTNRALLASIAEKTGYPVDMINDGMDLEADLGIDSIKRVEILAAVQERVPGMPEIAADRLAALRTVGDVGTALRGAMGAAPVVAAAPPASSGASAALYASIADKTGYPVDMLQPSMDLEADLGIDSIKRVEILAAVQERLPGLPEVPADRMAALRTVADVLMVLGAGAPSAPAVSAPPADSAGPLYAAIADKTGYPVDMLRDDMDLEADLGIDSIKRVEILAAVQERLPGVPDLPADRLAALRTVGDVRAALGASAPTPVAPAGDSMTVLLSVIADKTGYPKDLIQPSMDLEADLGIDSIKRVEILAAVQERLPGMPELPADRLSALRTVAEVHGALSSHPVAAAPAPRPAPVAAPRKPLPPRRVPRLVAAPPAHPAPLVGTVWVTRDDGGLAERLVACLVARGVDAVIHDAPWHDLDAVRATPKGAATLVHLAGVGATGAALDARCRGVLLLAAALGPLSSFVVVSSLGGGFGFGGRSAADPTEAAPAGLAKTAAREWPDSRVLAIDLAPGVSVERLADELGFTRGVVEVGLGADGVARTVTCVDAPHPQNAISDPIGPGDLVVVSGGARGVTAAVVRAMAKRFRPAFLLLGRSAHTDEPAWARGVRDDGLKAACLADARATGRALTPRALDHEVGAVRGAREVARTLAAVRDAGCVVTYAAVDVRDAAAVSAVVTAAVAAHGPVRGVVHAAGVLADKRIVDKTPDMVDRVWGTKIDGLDALIGAIVPSELRLLTAFASVAGRFGNVGQCDYAMANEALAHRLRALADAWPHVRTRVFDWGPWEGGMVDASLARILTDRGLVLIGLDGGATFFCDEVARTLPDVEVVLGGEMDVLPTTGVERRAFVPEGMPFLDDHRIAGRPVLPAVMALEWMVGAARRAFPDATVRAVHGVDVLKGIVVSAPTEATLSWRRAGDSLECTLTSVVDGVDRLAYRGRVELGSPTDPPRVAPEQPVASYPVPVDEAYRSFLFHGPSLRGIVSILGLTADGMAADVHTSAPSDLGEPGEVWATDPVVLDSALQMMLLWVHNHDGLDALPTSLGSFFVYRPFAGTVRCALKMRPTTRTAGQFDVVFTNDAGDVVAALRDARYATRLEPSRVASPSASVGDA